MTKVLVRLLAIQALVGLAVAVGFYFYVGLSGAIAAVYGVIVGFVVSLLLGWRMVRADKTGLSVGALMLGAAERIAFVCVAFAIGMAWLHLAPIAIIVGFMGAQCAYYVVAGPMRRHMVVSTGRQTHGD